MELVDNTYIDPILYKAASKGDFQPFERINIELSRIITTPDKSTILHIHLRSPSLPSTTFIEQVVNKCPSLLFQANVVGDVPLHVAAKYGNHSAVECLINHIKGSGGDVTEMLRKINNAGNTALHDAVEYEHPDVVRMLAKEDPDFSYSTNKLGESPLYIALQKRQRGTLLVRELLTNCRVLDFGGQHGMTALHAAVKNYDYGLTKEILERNQTLACKADEYGWTPLHYAAYYGRRSVVRELLKKDYRAAYMGDAKRNMTPLHLAAGKMNIEVMREIVTGCPGCCELVKIKGRNVLHFAILSSRFEDARIISEFMPVRKLLLDKDNDGNTPFHLFLTLHPVYREWKPIMDSYSFDTSGSLINSKYLHPPNLIKDEIIEMSKTFDEPYVYGIVTLPSSLKPRYEYYAEKRKEENDRKFVARIIGARDPHLVVAALIATVTFAAIFTMPGGYIQSGSAHAGSAILKGKSIFQVFIVFDVLAFILSILAVTSHFLTALGIVKTKYAIRLAVWAIVFTLIAMVAMLVALVAAAYVVLAPSWTAFFTVAIGSLSRLPALYLLILAVLFAVVIRVLKL